jgi:hypothetical protein
MLKRSFYGVLGTPGSPGSGGTGGGFGSGGQGTIWDFNLIIRTVY